MGWKQERGLSDGSLLRGLVFVCQLICQLELFIPVEPWGFCTKCYVVYLCV